MSASLDFKIGQSYFLANEPKEVFFLGGAENLVFGRRTTNQVTIIEIAQNKVQYDGVNITANGYATTNIHRSANPVQFKRYEEVLNDLVGVAQ